MSVLLGLAVVVATIYVLHRWEQEDRPRADPTPAPVPVDIDDGSDDPGDDWPDDDPDLGDVDDDEDEDAEDDDETAAAHDVDPLDAEWAGFPWFDDRSCWGCDRSCKRRAFRPYAGTNIGAEIRGAAASRARARADEPYSSVTDTPTRGQNGARRSTSVDAMWDDSCEACGRLVRRVEAGLEPVPGSTVAVESGAVECPF